MKSTHKRPATEAEAKALASPLRLRILRACLDEALTNKEIAARLDANPATILHHVRTLLTTGFLAAGPQRRGPRGSREIPYRATGKSWHISVIDTRASAAGVQAMIDAFLGEVRQVAKPEEIRLYRLGLRLNQEHRDEFERRIGEVLDEFADRGADPDGTPLSVFLAMHEDLSRS